MSFSNSFYSTGYGENRSKNQSYDAHSILSSRESAATTVLMPSSYPSAPAQTTVGLVLKQRRVDMIVEGGSAAINGNIRLGDEIIEVEGSPVSNETIVEAMKGEAGTKVRITFRRPATMEVFDVILVRHLLWGKATNISSSMLMKNLRIALESQNSDEITDYVNGIFKQINALENQILSYKNEAEESKKKVETFSATERSFQMKIRLLEDERDSLRVELQQRGDSKLDISRIQTQAEEKLSDAEARARIARTRAVEMEGSVAELTAKLESAFHQIKSYEIESKSLKDSMEKMQSQFQSQNDHLRMEQVNVQRFQESAMMMEKKYKDVSAVSNEYKKQLETSKANFEHLSEELAKLRSENRILIEQRTVRDSQLDFQMNERYKKLEAEYRLLQQKLSFEKERADSFDKKCSDLLRSLAEAEAVSNEFRVTLGRFSGYEEKIRILEREKEEADAMMGERMDLRHQVAQLKKELHIALGERDKVITTSEEKLRRKDQQIQDSNQAKSVAEGRTQEMSKAMDRLTEELEAARKMTTSIRVEAQETKQTLSAQLSDANVTIERLRADKARSIEKSEAEARISMLQQSLSKEKSEYTSRITDLEIQLRQILGDRDASEARVKEQARQIQSYMDEIMSMRAQLERLAVEKGAIEGKASQLSERAVSLETEIIELKSMLNSARMENQETRHTFSIQLSEAALTIERLRDDNRRLVDRDESETRISMLQQSLSKEKSEYTSRITDLEIQLRQILGDRDASEARVKEQARQIQSYMDEIMSMRAQLERLAVEKGVAEGRAAQSSERAASLEMDCLNIKTRLVSLERELSASEERLKSVKESAEKDRKHSESELLEEKKNRKLEAESHRCNFEQVIQQLRSAEELRRRDTTEHTELVAQKDKKILDLTGKVEHFSEKIRQQTDTIIKLENTNHTLRLAVEESDQALGSHSFTNRHTYLGDTHTHSQLV